MTVIKERVLILGGGDLARQIAHYIAALDPTATVVGFVDDTKEVGAIAFGKACLGSFDAIHQLYSSGVCSSLVIAFGYKHMAHRKIIFERFATSIPFYRFVHPSAYLDPSCRLGMGVVIGPGVVLDQNVVIGDNVFLYNRVTISHDSLVGAHSFLAPAVAIAGFCTVGACCFIGIGAVIADNLCVADGVTIGAGSLLLKSIASAGVYFGSPVKI